MEVVEDRQRMLPDVPENHEQNQADQAKGPEQQRKQDANDGEHDLSFE